MKEKTFLNFVAKVIEKNVYKEANSACAMIAYQPPMPDSVRKYKKRIEK